MKLIIILLCSLMLIGCANMTPAQKQTAWIVGGVVVGAIIISSDSSSEKKPNCKPTVGGSGSDFDFYCRPQ